MDVERDLLDWMFASFNARDSAWLELVDEDVVMYPTGADAGTVYRGREGGRAYQSDLFEVWEELTLTKGDVAPVGGRLLVEYRNHVRGRGSGIEVDQDFFSLVTIRDGKVIEWRNFESREQALQAADALPAPD